MHPQSIKRLLAALAALAAVFVAAPPAQALPSYARQTGQECAACHNGFPELTPYGRLFKLNGYTFGGGQSKIPPVAAMVISSFTHTQADQQGGAAPHFGPNDNITFQSASLFYGGAITENLGAFIQGTYDEIKRGFTWDNTDIRYAKSVGLLDKEFIFGVTANNNPTVTDVWNSTPAWGFPFLSSELAPTPGAATLIEGGLAQQVVGATTYGYWNRLLYGEIGAYSTLTKGIDGALGSNRNGDSIRGLAPYWRFAVEPKWGPHSFEVGTFGLAAAINPGRVTGSGTDHKVDVGVDAQYQFLGERDAFSVQADFINENQSLSASQALGSSTNTHNRLQSLHAKTTYWYEQTYGATLGYFQIQGTTDPGLFASSSLNNSPNSAGYVAELDYMPFNHGGPGFWPWLNLKLGLQYIYYDKFDGGRANFDGSGRDAKGNNTLFAFLWLAF